MFNSKVTYAAPQFPQVSNQVAQVSNQVPQVSNQVAQVSNQVPQVSNQVPQVSNQVAQVSDQVGQVSNQVAQVSNQVAQVSNQGSNEESKPEPVATYYSYTIPDEFFVSPFVADAYWYWSSGWTLLVSSICNPDFSKDSHGCDYFENKCDNFYLDEYLSWAKEDYETEIYETPLQCPQCGCKENKAISLEDIKLLPYDEYSDLYSEYYGFDPYVQNPDV